MHSNFRKLGEFGLLNSLDHKDSSTCYGYNGAVNCDWLMITKRKSAREEDHYIYYLISQLLLYFQSHMDWAFGILLLIRDKVMLAWSKITRFLNRHP